MGRRLARAACALPLLLAGPAAAQGTVSNPFASNLPSRPLPAPPGPGVDGARYPAAVAPRYAGRPAGLARRLTCLDQYRANKQAGTGNGGQRWTQAGGGYDAACNRRLGR
ncbi:hypothetical protein OPKNFCMD_3038 [Methylobacterium crusticola]|uniref:Lectin-like protein BA14k n=1 Tax=Methylobacterium crusticola TaxID=1697972 RepID=A0ABQ4R064_9HYPH|nr:hypothetical protein [Methylobacterium crusticola]GJD50299.1 hypothetical protein OPKNFCMD_3038 [Methylobacterium crusticola]